MHPNVAVVFGFWEFLKVVLPEERANELLGGLVETALKQCKSSQQMY